MAVFYIAARVSHPGVEATSISKALALGGSGLIGGYSTKKIVDLLGNMGDGSFDAVTTDARGIHYANDDARNIIEDASELLGVATAGWLRVDPKAMYKKMAQDPKNPMAGLIPVGDPMPRFGAYFQPNDVGTDVSSKIIIVDKAMNKEYTWERSADGNSLDLKERKKGEKAWKLAEQINSSNFDAYIKMNAKTLESQGMSRTFMPELLTKKGK